MNARRPGLTLVELVVALAVMALIALSLTAAFFLVFRGGSYAMGTNRNTDQAGQVVNRMVYGFASSPGLREGSSGALLVESQSNGSWRLDYQVFGTNLWMRYDPAAQTIVDQDGTLLGAQVRTSYAIPTAASNGVLIGIGVQTARDGRAQEGLLESRVEFRN